MTIESAPSAEFEGTRGGAYPGRVEDVWRAWIQMTREGVCVVDEKGCVTYANARFAELVGCALAEILAVPLRDVLGCDAGGALRPGLTAGPGMEGSREFELSGSDEESHWLALRQVALGGEGGGGEGRLVTLTDMTREKRQERHIERATFYDDLTGLASRLLLENRLEQALRTRAALSQPIAVLLIDIQGLRRVNDAYGHTVGDTLLNMVSERLLDQTREEDTIARFGGDEFAVLVNGIPDHRTAMVVAERMAEAFAEPFVIMKSPISIHASVGIAVSEGTHTDARDVIRRAHVAMQVAKDEPGTSCVAFDRRRDFAMTRSLHLEKDLDAAIQADHLQVHYQPIVELPTRRIVGAEALVRWEDPVRGTVFPAEFMVMAEETGLIVDLDRWVLAKVCEDLTGWLEKLPVPDWFVLGVNVSTRHLRDPAFVEHWTSTLEASSLDPKRFQLELPEGAILQPDADWWQIRNLGVKLAINDVGRGHASLENLANFELDALKIDRAFVRGLGSTSRDGAVVEAIVLMAERMGAVTIAEGIEREEQRERLVRLGCGFGQGYLFSRPEPLVRFEPLLECGHLQPQETGEGYDVLFPKSSTGLP